MAGQLRHRCQPGQAGSFRIFALVIAWGARNVRQ